MKENIVTVGDSRTGLSLLNKILTKKKIEVSKIEKTDDIYQSIKKIKPDLILNGYLLITYI
jgi:two-component SAPR family response regulator